jgi:hypothetical protein
LGGKDVGRMKVPFWKRTEAKGGAGVAVVQTGRRMEEGWGRRFPVSLRPGEAALYEGLREAVPIIDAALQKIVRLTSGFHLVCGDPGGQAFLDRFRKEIPVGAGGRGLDGFLSGYLMSLLTYGSAVGEMVLSPAGDRIGALYLSDLGDLELRCGENPLEAELLLAGPGGGTPLPYPELVFFSALNPEPGQAAGRSLLRGLPFLSSVLTEIYRAMGENFRRIGALRYAVTVKPEPGTDAGTIADAVAREWSGAMAASAQGEIRDFVAVGDVEIKVIGADNQFIDTQVPVRQLLEQIVAKTGLPPFLLGLSWSTTERMSRQQADILTTELESYRSILTPVAEKICRMALDLAGLPGEVEIAWESISLQDETEEANARYTNARAALLEQELKKKEAEG